MLKMFFSWSLYIKEPKKAQKLSAAILSINDSTSTQSDLDHSLWDDSHKNGFPLTYVVK